MTAGRLIVFVIVLIAFTTWPLLLQRSPILAALLAIAIVAWIVWSVTTYLQWARALGREKQDQAKIDRD